MVFDSDTINAFQGYDSYTDDNEQKQYGIKEFACPGICLKDGLIEFFFPG
jgi:hypothetical protein